MKVARALFKPDTEEHPSGPCPDCGRGLGEDPRARPIGAPQCMNPRH